MQRVIANGLALALPMFMMGYVLSPWVALDVFLSVCAGLALREAWKCLRS